MKIDWIKIAPVLQQVAETKAEDEEQANILSKLYAFLYVAEGFAREVKLALDGAVPWEEVMPAVHRSADYAEFLEPYMKDKFNDGTN